MNWIKKHKWLLFALVTTLTWGVWGEFSELIQKEGFPASMVYIVWALSMIPCAIVALWLAGWKLDHSYKSIFLGVSAGLLGAGGQLILFEALRFGPAYIVFPFVSMSPIITIALSLALLRERANRIQTFGIVIALAAIFFLSWQDGSDQNVSGYVWLILATLVFIAWGVQGYIMKSANNSMSAESIFFYMALTAVMLIPFAFTMIDTDISAIAPALYVKGFFTQILNSIGALTLVYAYRYGKAIIVSPMQGLAPLITMVLSLILYAVFPSAILLTGLILATIALIALSIE
ncbi:MAG: DMT family transporter [Alistipes sp.]